jgi:hypothetical protein
LPLPGASDSARIRDCDGKVERIGAEWSFPANRNMSSLGVIIVPEIFWCDADYRFYLEKLQAACQTGEMGSTIGISR